MLHVSSYIPSDQGKVLLGSDGWNHTCMYSLGRFHGVVCIGSDQAEIDSRPEITALDRGRPPPSVETRPIDQYLL
jgi:hypothetical protein